MSIKAVIARQLRENVNEARKQFGQVETPSGGWLRTVRTALGMSGAQLARRMGITRGAISRSEKAEIEGAITINTMKQIAANMNCRFVYAVIPDRDVEEIIEHRAREKATELVNQAGVHMALEAQNLTNQQMEKHIEQVVNDLLARPSSLWNEE
ncbi:mobile mystery protein A [Mariniblastus fucicola]|uniref:Helix-turn-helix protein n=1 Tax=Mariniblastus fucicola TaxID=980251 RepID=A0A5B9PFH7_9BACT|nr:mobile mystery protein A [Mariniblastus fucicola]QEG25188.1 helix-turn-helix protein [Mariniblastus fucicola]